MRKTKLSAGILGIITAAAAAVSLFVYASQDREGPEILFDESRQITYNSSMTHQELLEGVRAEDARDGDVSDTLQVEKVNELGAGAVITYVAMDRNYNVTKTERLLALEEDSAGDTPASVGAQPVTSTPAATAEPAEETVLPEETADTAEEEAARVQEMEEAIAALPPGSPEFRLSQHVVTLAAGSDFNSLEYVGSLTDDVDSSEDLHTRIQVAGEVDTSLPGTYELIYYVLDSDGNMSNEEVLEVIVE